MKALFEDIQAHLISKLGAKYPTLFIRLWNNQFEDMEQQQVYAFDFPCVFVEFVTENILQLGNGVQSYDPLIVRIHTGWMELDAIDGTMEQNLNAFTFENDVFKATQKFWPAGCCPFVRIAETHDYNHNNISIGTQDYRTNYIVQEMAEPVDGVQSTPPTTLDLDVDFDPPPYTKNL